MKLKDKAYIAGFIDADGCIGAIWDHPNRGGNALTLKVTISNTNLKLLKWIQSTVGYGKLITLKRYIKTAKICYELRFYGYKAKFILNLVKPFLRLKQRQCLLLLKTNLTYSNKHLSKKDVNSRKRLIKQLKRLNKRGI